MDPCASAGPCLTRQVLPLELGVFVPSVSGSWLLHPVCREGVFQRLGLLQRCLLDPELGSVDSNISPWWAGCCWAVSSCRACSEPSPSPSQNVLGLPLSWSLSSWWPMRIRGFGISPPRDLGVCVPGLILPVLKRCRLRVTGSVCSLGDPAPSLCLLGPNSGTPGAAGGAGGSAGLREHGQVPGGADPALGMEIPWAGAVVAPRCCVGSSGCLSSFDYFKSNCASSF